MVESRRGLPRAAPALLMLALSMAEGCAPGPSPSGAGPAAGKAIMLRPYFRDLRTVVAVVGRDTLTLLFDTGAGATLVTPSVAARLGCRPYGRDVGQRMGGEAVEFQRCDSMALGIGDWVRTLAPIAVFDVNALLPEQLPRLDGVLGLDAFDGHMLSIDWPTNQLMVRPAGSRTAGTPLPTRRATGTNGRFLSLFVKVDGRRGDLWLLLDSGNLTGLVVDPHVVRDSLLPLVSDTLARIIVDGMEPILEPFHRRSLVIDGALGTSFLKRGPITLDLARR